jgi:hypothetical protein
VDAVRCLRAKTVRHGIDPAVARICCFAGRDCGVYSAPHDFGPQTLDAGWTELMDGISKMENPARVALMILKSETERSME